MIRQLLFILFTSILPYACAKVNPTRYTFKKVGDLPIEAVVYVPPVTLYEKYPVVFAIHGGALICGNAENFLFSPGILDELLTRGWVVVAPNFRLAPAASIPDMIEDLQDGYKWVREELVKIIPINTDAIGLWGASSGGGLALAAGSAFEPRPKAVVVLYPYLANFTTLQSYDPDLPIPEDLITLVDALRQEHLSEYEMDHNSKRWELHNYLENGGRIGWLLAASNPRESPENILKKLKEYSPVFHVDENYPPTYFVHGMDDGYTSVVQSAQMGMQLRLKGVVHILDLVKNRKHGFDFVTGPEDFKKHISPLFGFLAKYISPEK